MINSIYPLIIITDLADSTAFYRDALGLIPVLSDRNSKLSSTGDFIRS